MTINKEYASTNFWPNNNPRSVMLHTTGGGSVIGAVETLIARGLSYNYIIDDNGVVYQLVDFANSAWHAGVIKSPNLRAKVFYGSLKGEYNPNRHSVGISYVYPVGNKEILSDKAVDATVKLLKHIGMSTGVRYTADNIFYHQEVTSDKPIMVKGYREQVLEAIVGDKDEKDSGEVAQLKLIIKYLFQIIGLYQVKLKQA
jgi:N-acetyl-anhydromuramyl-L-alanine amidase AmpD